MDRYQLIASLTLLAIWVFLVEWGDEYGVTSGSAVGWTFLVGVGGVLVAIFLYNFALGYREP